MDAFFPLLRNPGSHPEDAELLLDLLNTEELEQFADSLPDEVDSLFPSSEPTTGPTLWLQAIGPHADVAAETAKLARLVEMGCASKQVLDSWGAFLQSDTYLLPTTALDGAPQLKWRKIPSARLIRAFMNRIDVQVVRSLGRDVAALGMSGPHRIQIVLARTAFHDALEAEFLLYHVFLHTFGGIRHEGQGPLRCWVELARDIDPASPLLSTVRNASYRRLEAKINDGATCLMYDYYVDGPRMTELSRSLAHDALSAGIVDVPLIKTIFGDRSFLREVVGRRLYPAIYSFVAGSSLGPLLRPKLLFSEHLAVIRQDWWKPVYLVGADTRGGKYRLWIPSNKVLRALGFRLNDVPIVGKEVPLTEYGRAGILVKPEDVEYFRASLEDNRQWLPSFPGSTKLQLKGRSKLTSSVSFPEDERSERLELEMDAITVVGQEKSIDVD